MQTVDFYHNQDTPVYLCFLDAKKALDRVNRWMLAKKLLDRNVALHIVKLFIFWYREQEFMVRWGIIINDIPLCKWDQAGGKLSPLLYNVYTDDLNHHLQAAGVGCYVGGAWVNSLSYADVILILAPTVTVLQTLLEVARMLDLMTLYTTQRKQYLCWSGQNNHRSVLNN